MSRALHCSPAEQETPLFAVGPEVTRWARQHPLSAENVDCAIAVMLKILDGKCKMPEHEKVIMACLYETIKGWPSRDLGADMHELIQYAKTALDSDGSSDPDDSLRLFIYEKRVLAESRISRPVMKAFKRMLRETGLLPQKQNSQQDTL